MFELTSIPVIFHKAPIPLTRHVGKNVYAIVLENLHAFIVALGRIYVAHADSIRP